VLTTTHQSIFKVVKAYLPSSVFIDLVSVISPGKTSATPYTMNMKQKHTYVDPNGVRTHDNSVRALNGSMPYSAQALCKTQVPGTGQYAGPD